MWPDKIREVNRSSESFAALRFHSGTSTQPEGGANANWAEGGGKVGVSLFASLKTAEITLLFDLRISLAMALHALTSESLFLVEIQLGESGKVSLASLSAFLFFA
jgi:hypothetical protein